MLHLLEILPHLSTPGAPSRNGRGARRIPGDVFFERMEVLVGEMLKDQGVRLPGARREALRRKAEAAGIQVPDALIADASP